MWQHILERHVCCVQCWVSFCTAHNTRHSTTRCHNTKYIYTGCPRRNVPDFGRVFLMLKYTDITQNTYIQSWTFREIMAREKCGLLAVPNTATCTADTSRDNANIIDSGMQCSLCLRDALRSQPCYVTAGLFSCIVIVTLRTTMKWVRVLL